MPNGDVSTLAVFASPLGEVAPQHVFIAFNVIGTEAIHYAQDRRPLFRQREHQFSWIGLHKKNGTPLEPSLERSTRRAVFAPQRHQHACGDRHQWNARSNAQRWKHQQYLRVVTAKHHRSPNPHQNTRQQMNASL